MSRSNNRLHPHVQNKRSRSPISALPPEILEAIFALCISQLYTHPPYTPPTDATRRRLQALACTQVCSSWRLLSLASPRLWRTIDLVSGPRFIGQCLERSKATKIDIISSISAYAPIRLVPSPAKDSGHEIDQTSSPVPLRASKEPTGRSAFILSLLRSNAHRIRSINLFLVSTDIHPLFHHTLSSLPSLTSLTLRLPPTSPFLHQPTPVIPMSLPLVRHLSLEGVALCRVAWGELHSVRHLSLKDLDEDTCPSVEDVLGILERSPGLVVLRLQDWRPSCSLDSVSRLISDETYGDRQRRPQSIFLPKLNVLTISSTQGIVASLFSSNPRYHLVLTSQTRMRLFLSLSDDLHKLFPTGMPWTGYHRPSATDRHRNALRSSISNDGTDRDRTSSFKVDFKLPLLSADHDRSELGCGSELDGIVHPPQARTSAASKNYNTEPTIQTIRLSKNGCHFLTAAATAWLTDSPSQTQQDDADLAHSPILFSLSSARAVGMHISASLPYLLGQRLSCVTKLELNTGVLTSGGLGPAKGGGESGITEDGLRRLFQNLAGLEALCVAFNDLNSLWNVLLPSSNTEGSSNTTTSPLLPQSSRALLPRLTRLSFGKPSEVWCNFSNRWSASLLRFIMSRSPRAGESASGRQADGSKKDIFVESIEFVRCQGIQRSDADDEEYQVSHDLKRLVPVVLVR